MTAKVSAFAQLVAPAVGGGGWEDYAFVADAEGVVHERRGDIGAPITQRRDNLHLVRLVVAARDARRIARVAEVTAPASFRSDTVEVLEVDGRWTSIVRWAPPTQDGFEIDWLALSPGGTRVGLTGVEIAYQSSFEWGSMAERGYIVDVPSGARRASMFFGDVHGPLARTNHPIALGEAASFVGRHVLSNEAPPDLDLRETLYAPIVGVERRISSMSAVEDVLALDGDGYLLVLEYGANRYLVFGHPMEPAESDSERMLSDTPTALTAVRGAVLVGYADGRVVRVER